MKAGARPSQRIIIEMLSALPTPFTVEDLISRWPEDQQMSVQAVQQSACHLARRGLIRRVSSKGQHTTQYAYTPEPEPELPPQEQAWRLFKLENHIE